MNLGKPINVALLIPKEAPLSPRRLPTNPKDVPMSKEAVKG